MVRYIDADKLIKTLFPIGLIDDGKYTINAKAVKYAIDNTPTADVVPKSEVDRLETEVKALTENSITTKYPNCVLGSYYAILTKSLEDYDKLIADISAETKAEVAREIFEEFGKIMERYLDSPLCNYHKIRIDFAELKNKYTEVNNG